MRESLGHYKAPSFVTRCKLNSLGVGYSCVWMSFSLCLHVSTDSTVAVAMYYPWQASVNIYYTIQSVNNLWLVKLFWFIIFLCLLSYYSRRLENHLSLSLSLSLLSRGPSLKPAQLYTLPSPTTAHTPLFMTSTATSTNPSPLTTGQF